MACAGTDNPSATTGPCCGPSSTTQVDSCCQSPAKPSADNGCRGSSNNNTDTKSPDANIDVSATGCCGNSGKTPPVTPSVTKSNRSSDACCSSEPTEPEAKDMTTCNSALDIDEREDPDNPSCCKGKSSPCCDAFCLDRIALRECDSGDAGPPSKCQSRDGRPCETHRRSAREKYAARLEALGCICRALLALGQESCCPPPLLNCSRLSFEKKRRSTDSARSMLHASVDSCCGESETKLERRRSGSSKRGDCSSGCCRKMKQATSATLGSSTIGRALGGSDSCLKDCCAGSGTPTAAIQPALSTEPSKSGDCTKGCCSKLKPDTCTSVQPPASTAAAPGEPSGCSKGCCGKPANPSAVKECGSTAKDATVIRDACSKGCCGGSQGSFAAKCGPVDKEKATRSGCCPGGCCGKLKVSSCASPKQSDDLDGCSIGCCRGAISPCATIKQADSFTEKIEALPDKVTPDLEKGNTGREHVILSISGMTCTGCETKLKRTLGTLPSVRNLKTSLVLSRAEFDLDVGVQPYDELLKYMARTTEFKYERVTDRGSNVDVVVPNAAEFMKRDWPYGVTEITLVDKRTVNIAFDAKVAGARDLVERGWDRPFTLAAPGGDPTLAAGNRHVRNVGYMTLLSIVLTIPVLVLAWAPLPEREIAYGSASLALATIVQVVIAGPFYPKALKALIFSRIIEMDLLIVLSTSAAYIFSVVSFGYLVSGEPLSTGEFFETSTLLVTLIMVGRYVAALARQKAVESISIRSLQTQTVILVDESGASEKEIGVRLLQYGDTFKVVPDSKIPTDGTVLSGSSEVNESMITGESIPVEKGPRSAVVAGSVNGSGTLIVKPTRLPADNTISVIAGLVDQAKLSKPKIQDIADRVASYFVPVVVALTVITFVIWIAVGIAVRHQSGSRATTEAITYAITVLIVSCPCAIGLAVPMVIVIASGVAAERGIIFKAADSIEVAYRASHVIFDKTGTLTAGKLTVAVEDIVTSNPDTLSLLLGLIGNNKHPISTAVATHLKEKGISATTVADAKALTGKGVESITPSLILRAGNSHWLNLTTNPRVQSILNRNYTAFCFTINDFPAAVFGLEDSLRPDALSTITALQNRGMSVHILSGDDDSPVQSVAAQLNVPESQVRARCTPTDKQTYIKTLHSNSGKKIKTIFIGDGTNDAPALATATIGVHMNQTSGTDVAKSAADVILMRPDLSGILTMMRVSKKAVDRIKFNFGWSFVYNLFAVLLGAGAFQAAHARIPPQFAGLGEVVSVLPVVVAAVVLRWERI